MDGLLLDHFQQLMVILYDLHACYIGMCGTSQGQSTLTDSLTQYSHSESQHQ